MGGKGLKDMMEPMVADSESVHAGAYQFGDWAMSGEAGGADSCFKKYICPDKFQWHSGLAVTENKILGCVRGESVVARIACVFAIALGIDDACAAGTTSATPAPSAWPTSPSP